MDGTHRSADDFDNYRPRLRAVAYRMLGSTSDAEDAVQEAWIRLNRSDTSDVHNMEAWLTTVVARVCLDMLRTRAARREDPLETHVPDPIIAKVVDDDPAEHAVLADSVGLALLVVLDTLSPTERLAFVLHDVFSVPFDQIGTILDRSPAAAKQLASRARGRLSGTSAVSNASPRRQRQVVDAFLAASREGDFEGLLRVLDPDVLLRADAGNGPLGLSQLVRGAAAVAGQALRFSSVAQYSRPVLVNGTPGLLAVRDGQALSLLSVVIIDDRIVEMDILADPARLAALDLSALDD